MIKTGDDYCEPEFIEFENNQIIHFELEKESENGFLKKVQEWSENLTESKYRFINDNRIRFYRMGKSLTVISETESISKDIEVTIDYEKIEPTKTELTKKEIEKLEFKAEWNKEIIPFKFNIDLSSPKIKELNNSLNKEGEKIILENLQGTYFASIYSKGKRRVLIGINEIDKTKALIFGFPKRPYQIIAK